MKYTYFITGTDTGVGKTFIACALLHAARAQGKTTLGLKPVAAGADVIGDEKQNADARALMQYASVSLPYQQVNPVLLQEPIAPHIAAQHENKRLSAARLEGYCRGALMQGAEFTVIEGAGGWRVPLNASETLADLAIRLRCPVVLVVGMKLGCINHALLTVEALRNDKISLAGWVANQCDASMLAFEENVDSLIQRINAPCLGVVKYDPQTDVARAAQAIDISRLLPP
jgi:dethiobiotin synthetase